MPKIFMRKISRELQGQEEYYLIDYDFKEPHDPKRMEFYRKLRKLLQEKVISRYTATTSVIIIRDLNLAERIYELAVNHGGVANLRKAVTIKSSLSAQGRV